MKFMNLFKKKYTSLLISILLLVLYFALPYSFLTICSNSMSKTLNAEDIIFYKKIDASYNLKKGDIIVFEKLYKPTNKVIKLIHRIDEVQMWKDEVWLYRTKGDASDSVDEFIVYPEEIIGVYTGKIDKIGYPIAFVRKLLARFDGTSQLYKEK